MTKGELGTTLLQTPFVCSSNWGSEHDVAAAPVLEICGARRGLQVIRRALCPRLELRIARDSHDRAAARGEADGVVLLDGEHLVGEALRADVAVEHVAVTPAAHERNEQVLAALARAGAEIDVVSAKVMDALSPVRSSADIVALAVRPGPAAGRSGCCAV